MFFVQIWCKTFHVCNTLRSLASRTGSDVRKAKPHSKQIAMADSQLVASLREVNPELVSPVVMDGRHSHERSSNENPRSSPATNQGPGGERSGMTELGMGQPVAAPPTEQAVVAAAAVVTMDAAALVSDVRDSTAPPSPPPVPPRADERRLPVPPRADERRLIARASRSFEPAPWWSCCAPGMQRRRRATSARAGAISILVALVRVERVQSEVGRPVEGREISLTHHTG